MSRPTASFPVWLRTVGDRVKGRATVQADPAGVVVVDLPYGAVALLGQRHKDGTDERHYRVTLTPGQADRLAGALDEILDALEKWKQEAAA